MSIRKFVVAIIMFSIVSFGLLYGIPRIIPIELIEAYDSFMSPSLGYGLGVIVSVSYLVMSYRKIYTPTEIEYQKYEYYYNSFDQEKRAILDAMTEEDKKRFIDEYESLLPFEKRKDLFNKIFDWTHGFIPRWWKPVRIITGLLLICSITYTSYIAYESINESYNTYAARVFELMPDGIYHYEGLPAIDLQIERNGRIPFKRDVDMMAEEMIESQPKFLWNYCSVIHVFNHEKYDEIKPTELAYAFASSSDNSINLTFWESSMNVKTVTHELCHLFDYAHGMRYDANLIELYQKHAAKISDYATTDVAEFFAEAGAEYFHSPESMKQNAPEVYNYLDTLFKPYL